MPVPKRRLVPTPPPDELTPVRLETWSREGSTASEEARRFERLEPEAHTARAGTGVTGRGTELGAVASTASSTSRPSSKAVLEPNDGFPATTGTEEELDTGVNGNEGRDWLPGARPEDGGLSGNVT